MENIETAILLMVVGMATVFVILLIVIYLGKLLITLVNKYAPEEVIPAKKEALQGPAPIPGNIMAAITAAVMAAKMFPGTGAGPWDASRFTGTTSSGAYLLTNVINNLPK